MTHFHIEGLPPFDGDYPCDLTYFTNKELHTIKTLSGVRAGEMEEALAAEDNDLIVAFCVIALERAGKTMTRDATDVIWNAPIGKITFVAEEDEESPPGEAPPSETSESGAGKNGSSGHGSSNGGDLPESDRSPTGDLSLVAGSASGRAT